MLFNARSSVPTLFALALLCAQPARATQTSGRPPAPQTEASKALPKTAPKPDQAAKNIVHRAGDLTQLARTIERVVRAEASELVKMEAHLSKFFAREHVQKSFKHGSDDVDCVAVSHQPSMKRAGMAGHQISRAPAALKTPGAATGKNAMQNRRGTPASIFLSASQQCPASSVPIRRPQLTELKSFKTLQDWFRKQPSHLIATPKSPGPPQPQAVKAPWLPNAALGPSSLHQYAHAAKYNLKNYGAHSALNVWNPRVQDKHEFSLSQIWITRGSGAGLQTLEVGVQLYPDKYGDNQARLFVYSTSDGYAANTHDSGCYNLDCGRFVQVSKKIAVGTAFDQYSTTGGSQREIEAAWLKFNNDWWLSVQGEWVGYYPGGLFNAGGLKDHADNIDFGGEIIDDRNFHAWHSTTAMGSGAYPVSGFGQAAYQRRIWYFDAPTSAKWATGLSESRTNKSCYDISTVSTGDPNWGTYFFFGGPGFNLSCL